MPLDRTTEFSDAIPLQPSIVVDPPNESHLTAALRYLRLTNAKRKVRNRPVKGSVPIVRFLYKGSDIEQPKSEPLDDHERDEIDAIVKTFIQETMKEISGYRQATQAILDRGVLEDESYSDSKHLWHPVDGWWGTNVPNQKDLKSENPIAQETNAIVQNIQDSTNSFPNATAWTLSTMLNELINLQKLLQQKRYEREIESRVWRSELPQRENYAFAKESDEKQSTFTKLRGATWGILEKVGLPSARAVVIGAQRAENGELATFASGLAEIGSRLREEQGEKPSYKTNGGSFRDSSSSKSESGQNATISSFPHANGSLVHGSETSSNPSSPLRLDSTPLNHASNTAIKTTSLIPSRATTTAYDFAEEDIVPESTPAQRQTLMLENEAVHDQFQAELQELDNIQSAITEIASLQTNLSVQIAEQAEKVQALHKEAEEQNQNVTEGNQLLKKARKTLNEAYRYVAWIFLGLAIALAFLDWIG